MVRLFTFIAFFSISSVVWAETHIWDKTPISVILGVGQEKRLEFPEGINELKVMNSVNESSRIMTVPGDPRVYWTANDTFDKSRVIAVSTSGYHYYLDITAVKHGGNTSPLLITRLDDANHGDVQPQGQYDYVDLARYVAQHFHGPARLIEPLYGISRVSLPYQTIPHLIRGYSLTARPVMQWRSQTPPLYITAVELSNNTDKPVEILPSAVRGNFLFAAPHNSMIMPRDSLGDTSLIYLISKLPFNQAADIQKVGVTHD